jgi:hypothetical protein
LNFINPSLMKHSVILLLLFSVLNTCTIEAQKSGNFQILFDYGVDRDISVVYQSLPSYGQDVILSQVTSKHPRVFSVLYQWGKSNWKYRVGAGMLTRSLQKYKQNEGIIGHTNYSQYLGIAGIARTKRINYLMSLTYGIDLIVSYENSIITLEESVSMVNIEGYDPFIWKTTVYFRGNNGEFVPMFCPYIQTGIQLNKDTKLVLGMGIYGQFYKSYRFDMNVAGIIPGNTSSIFLGSDVFHMWVPFLRAGIELF